MEDFKSKMREKITKETIWSVLTKGVGFVFYILLTVYLARTLGTARYGKWNYFYSIFTIILILSSMGVNQSTKKYIAEYSGTGKEKFVFIDSIIIRMVTSLLFCLIVVIFYKSVGDIINRPDIGTLLLYSAPLLLLLNTLSYLKEVFNGNHDLKYTFLITSSEHLLKFIFVVLLLSIENHIYSVIAAYMLAVTSSVVIGAYFSKQEFIQDTGAEREERFYKDIYTYSLPMLVVSIAFLIATEVDIVMLGYLADDQSVGIYSVAKRIISKLPHISIAISMGVMPIFAKMDESNASHLKKIFIRVVGAVAGIYLAISVFILVFADPIVPYIFGDEYIRAVLPTQILTVYLVLSGSGIIVNQFLDYQGLARKRAKYIIVSIFINVLLNFLLIPRYGATGAAIATSVSYFPYVILNFVEAQKAFLTYTTDV